MKRIITDYYDSLREEKPFELSVFSLPDMAARELFQKEPLYCNCLSWAEEELGRRNTAETEAAAVMAQIPNPHLLIAGFGRYGQAVLEQALLIGSLSYCSEVPGYEKLRITIIDHNIKACQDVIESRYPRIEKIGRISYIKAEMESIEVERQLSLLPPVTYMVLCFSSQAANVSAMEKLKKYLLVMRRDRALRGLSPARIPIAVRMKTNASVIQFWMEADKEKVGESGKIRNFGTNKKILTRENIIRYGTEEEAKGFHENYIKLQRGLSTAEKDEKTREELWQELDFEKRESSRAQVLYQPYIQALFPLLPSLPDKEAILTQKGSSFLECLDTYPVLDILAAQEHQRWCNFCYTSGYAGYHPDQSEKGKFHRIEEDREYYGKVHYCLIDGWNEMKEDVSAKETIIYDVCAIYGYFSNQQFHSCLCRQ